MPKHIGGKVKGFMLLPSHIDKLHRMATVRRTTEAGVIRKLIESAIVERSRDEIRFKEGVDHDEPTNPTGDN